MYFDDNIWKLWNWKFNTSCKTTTNFGESWKAAHSKRHYQSRRLTYRLKYFFYRVNLLTLSIWNALSAVRNTDTSSQLANGNCVNWIVHRPSRVYAAKSALGEFTNNVELNATYIGMIHNSGAGAVVCILVSSARILSIYWPVYK